MNYTLYTAENCHQCTEVSKYLRSIDVDCKKINIDIDDEKPPIDIFAFPALFEGDELIGYGTDIISYFIKYQRT